MAKFDGGEGGDGNVLRWLLLTASLDDRYQHFESLTSKSQPFRTRK